MIKFTCINCTEPMEAPDSLTGQLIDCPQCQTRLHVPPFSSPGVPQSKILDPEKKLAPLTDRVKTKTGNLLTRIWLASPPAFRTGFLATMGGMAAVLLSLFLYTRFILPAPANSSLPETSPSTSDFNPAPIADPLSLPHYHIFRDYLNTHHFFIVTDQIDVLGGRQLTEHLFAFDANYEFPNISVWVDQDDLVVGLSANWSAWHLDKKSPFYSYFETYRIGLEGHFETKDVFESLFDAGPDKLSIYEMDYQPSAMMNVPDSIETSASTVAQTIYGPMKLRVICNKIELEGTQFFEQIYAAAINW